MSDRITRYDEEFKKNAVQLSYASSRPVREVAEDLGISEALLYRLRKKFTKDGDKTPFATIEEENRNLRKQLAASRIDIYAELRHNKRINIFVCSECNYDTNKITAI
jgi:transposase